ncbi:MAG: polymer-forming cytoskeletal protein [Candidatus Omnitrophica bacterium]|nr:polymer-forming cytoskeletal protein [Candidatus Omnitrophota bacterium]
MARRKPEEEKILDVNAAMQGSLVFSDPVNLRINGKFEGTLTTKGNLIVGASAQVVADIIGESIVISGKVKGKVKASKMVALTLSSNVIGDIETPKVSIESGAVFNGKLKMPQGKMTLGELSDYLSVEERKIEEWVNNGRIPAEKMGDAFVFDRQEVEVWISQNT